MSDALVSPAVFAVTGAFSLTAIGVAIGKVKKQQSLGDSERYIVPLMGVMGAFIFAAQMINFAIPGTGSSGHIIGGILLSAVLGPWAAFITLSSVIVIQCFLFADGGFMALGCNILNMAFFSCLVAYPLIFRPILRRGISSARILWASLSASVAALLLGALAVSLETEASGVTALPLGRFLSFMIPIHFLIGIGEGLATAAVLSMIRRYKPEMLDAAGLAASGSGGVKSALGAFAVATLIVGGLLSWAASSKPDGLEWSVGKTAGMEELPPSGDELHCAAAEIQNATALMPDYDTSLSGILGSGCVVLLVLGMSYLLRAGRKPS